MLPPVVALFFGPNGAGYAPTLLIEEFEIFMQC